MGGKRKEKKKTVISIIYRRLQNTDTKETNGPTCYGWIPAKIPFPILGPCIALAYANLIY